MTGWLLAGLPSAVVRRALRARRSRAGRLGRPNDNRGRQAAIRVGDARGQERGGQPQHDGEHGGHGCSRGLVVLMIPPREVASRRLLGGGFLTGAQFLHLVDREDGEYLEEQHQQERDGRRRPDGDPGRDPRDT